MFKSIYLFLLIGISMFGQVLTVKDAKTLKPLPLVSVYTGELNKSLITDANGKVEINTFKNESSITFQLLGYEKKSKSYEEIKAENFEILLSELPVLINDIVISANRWENFRAEVPYSIGLITEKEIADQNPQTTADMLMQSGHVFIQKSQLGGGSPMIRGFATNRVLIVVDNVRLNNAIFRSGNLQNVISLDANSLSDVEVIFSPGSVIYGSDAIGGVMEFNTLDPQYSHSGQLLFGGNSFVRYSSANNERMGHLNFNLGLEKWSFLTSASYSKFGDLKMGSDGSEDYLREVYQDRLNGQDIVITNSDPELQIPSGYEQLNLIQKINFSPDEDRRIHYGFHYSTTSDVPRYDRLIEMKDGLPRDAQWYYGPQKWMMNNFSIFNFAGNKLFDLSKIILAHQHFEESRHNRNFGNSKLNHRTEKVNAFSINLDFVKNLNEKSQLYYGIETVFNSVGSTGESENIETNVKAPISTRYPDGSVWNSYGVYASYKNKLSDAFILQTGLRYNLVYLKADFDTTFFPFPFTTTELKPASITGSAGLTWFPNPNMQIYLNLSTGFRAPNIDDLGKVFDSSPGSVVIPNPNLKAEYVYNSEVGVIQTINKHFKLELAGFYSYLDNAMVRRDFTLNGEDSIYYDGTMSQVQAIQNAAFAYVYGIQAGIDFNFAENFELISKFSYQNGEEEDDAGEKAALRHAAPWYGTTRLTYKKDGFYAMLYADYNGEVSYEELAFSEREKTAIYAKDENGNPFSPSWYTLNFKAGIQLLEKFLVNAGVENITDQRYRTYSSGISSPGRNFIGSVRFDF
jgi:hemoglobin/transferrin/lactoferrin receptor protein